MRVGEMTTQSGHGIPFSEQQPWHLLQRCKDQGLWAMATQCILSSLLLCPLSYRYKVDAWHDFTLRKGREGREEMKWIKNGME